MEINRREFLGLSGSIVAWHLAGKSFLRLVKPTLAANRLAEWAPNLNDLVEWRYTAGRIVSSGQDFGFIVSVASNRIPGSTSQELLVQRQDFTGGQAFVGRGYTGTLTYEAATATYTFQDETSQELAKWQWDEAAQVYRLTVTTTELTLIDLVFRPQGELIAEGGDGDIRVGQISGVPIASDYHADWTNLEISSVASGTARVDMQGLRPLFSPVALASWPGPGIQQETTPDYDHHWFALALELDDGSPAWVSAWRIEDSASPFWTVTIAQGSGAAWQIVRSLTEESGPEPVAVEVLAWQEIPPVAGVEPSLAKTGQRWRLKAPDGSLDVEIAVPPGQFITQGPQTTLRGQKWMEEAVGLEVTGTVLNRAITSVKVAVAEATAEFYLNFMPAVIR